MAARNALVHRARHPARQPEPARPMTRTSSRIIRARLRTSNTCFPMGFSRARGHRQPGRLRPPGARRGLRREARVLRPADQGALRPVRDRARCRRRPGDPRLHGRRLRDRGGRGAPAHGPAPAPQARPRQGRGAAARFPQDGMPEKAPGRSSTSCATGSRPSSTRAGRSASATAARTRSARRGASPSTGRPPRTTPSPCATATPSSSGECRSTGSPTRSRFGSTEPWQSPKLA